MKSNLTTWKFNQRILHSEDYKFNNKVAKITSKKSFGEICKKYTHISYQDMEKFIKFDKKIYASLKGSGVDLGGGVGLLSSIIAKKKYVKKFIVLKL